MQTIIINSSRIYRHWKGFDSGPGTEPAHLQTNIYLQLKWVFYLITIKWMQKVYLSLFSLPWCKLLFQHLPPLICEGALFSLYKGVLEKKVTWDYKGKQANLIVGLSQSNNFYFVHVANFQTAHINPLPPRIIILLKKDLSTKVKTFLDPL